MYALFTRLKRVKTPFTGRIGQTYAVNPACALQTPCGLPNKFKRRKLLWHIPPHVSYPVRNLSTTAGDHRGPYLKEGTLTVGAVGSTTSTQHLPRCRGRFLSFFLLMIGTLKWNAEGTAWSVGYRKKLKIVFAVCVCFFYLRFAIVWWMR